MIFAYVRISTDKKTQKTDRQIQTLKEYAKDNSFKYDEVIEERISGTVAPQDRPLYSDLKNRLRIDDILVITDIDRLGRNADDTISELKDLKAKGIKVIALDTPFMNEWNRVQDDSTYNMIIDILITLKSHIAQQEREKLSSRIKQGLDATREKGTVLGRPQTDISDFSKEYEKFLNGEYGDMTVTKFSKMLEIGRSTFYKYKNIYEEQNK